MVPVPRPRKDRIQARSLQRTPYEVMPGAKQTRALDHSWFPICLCFTENFFLPLGNRSLPTRRTPWAARRRPRVGPERPVFEGSRPAWASNHIALTVQARPAWKVPSRHRLLLFCEPHVVLHKTKKLSLEAAFFRCAFARDVTRSLKMNYARQ